MVRAAIGDVKLTGIKDLDITTIFANLLDNAIEAAREIKNDAYIDLKMDYFNEFIVVSIRNSMGESESTKEGHMGIGLENVRYTLENITEPCTPGRERSVSGQHHAAQGGTKVKKINYTRFQRVVEWAGFWLWYCLSFGWLLHMESFRIKFLRILEEQERRMPGRERRVSCFWQCRKRCCIWELPGTEVSPDLECTGEGR